MATVEHRLSFERPIYEVEARLDKLERLAGQNSEAHNEIRRMRRELIDLKKSIYSNLKPWETVEVARHPNRPMTTDYLELVFDEFVELHGDKCFGDDRAIRTGWAKLDTFKVMVVGHQKGKTIKEKNACYFGCAHPEGYRKAILKMKMAAKFHLPVICFIDTPGAWPGVGAEERGQAQVIANAMFEMSRLPTPVICVVIGEGGSGGALGIGVGDRVAMLEHSYYSVISPEGCAGILWKSHTYKEEAARALKMTSKDLIRLGVVDAVISEPLGGAHRDHHDMAARLKLYVRSTLRDLIGLPIKKLLEGRYDKFRRMGTFLEGPSTTAAEQNGHCGVADVEIVKQPLLADQQPFQGREPTAVVKAPKPKQEVDWTSG
jgi:acetyl-CoA carboxylase carboxyl transferase subunit alpha